MRQRNLEVLMTRHFSWLMSWWYHRPAPAAQLSKSGLYMLQHFQSLGEVRESLVSTEETGMWSMLQRISTWELGPEWVSKRGLPLDTEAYRKLGPVGGALPYIKKSLHYQQHMLPWHQESNILSSTLEAFIRWHPVLVLSAAHNSLELVTAMWQPWRTEQGPGSYACCVNED